MKDSPPTLPEACDNARAKDAPDRFVQVRPEALRRWCDEHGVAPSDRHVLAHLVGEADWRTGTVDGFNLTRCSAELGLGNASGRRTLSGRIARLAGAGAIAYLPARGNHPGHLAVVLYGDFVKRSVARKARDGSKAQPGSVARLSRDGSKAQHDSVARLSRDGSKSVARLSRDGSKSVARLSRDGSAVCPVLPGVLPSEDVDLEDKVKSKTTTGGRDVQQHTSAPPPPPGRSLGGDLDPKTGNPDVEQACLAIAGYVEAGGGAPPAVSPRWRGAVAARLRAGVERAELERVMRWALCENDFWPSSGCDVPALVAKFDTLRRQADRARRRPTANALTAPTTDRATSGLVSL